MTPFRPPASLRKDRWVSLATRRLTNVLSKRIAATLPQLEVKLAESGPPDQRPDPHIISAALTDHRLFKRRRFGDSDDPDLPYLYALTATPDALVSDREEELRLPYDFYRLLVGRKAYCGDVLEGIVSASFAAVAGYIPDRLRYPAEPLDGVYMVDGHRLGVEDKNIRAWLYPSNEEIWETLRKCALEGAQPLLVARKIHWLTFQLFSQIGAMGFEFHRQVFAERTAPHLVGVQHTDLLGFKDVIATPIAAHPPLVKFLDTTLRNNASAFSRRWDEHRKIVEEYAVTRNLAAMSKSDRRAESAEFLRKVLPGKPPEGFDEYFDL